MIPAEGGVLKDLLLLLVLSRRDPPTPRTHIFLDISQNAVWGLSHLDL